MALAPATSGNVDNHYDFGVNFLSVSGARDALYSQSICYCYLSGLWPTRLRSYSLLTQVHT